RDGVVEQVHRPGHGRAGAGRRALERTSGPTRVLTLHLPGQLREPSIVSGRNATVLKTYRLGAILIGTVAALATPRVGHAQQTTTDTGSMAGMRMGGSDTG